MHLPSEPVIQPEWQPRNEEPPDDDATRWLSLVQRFSFVRAHISVFAVGSVVLLAVNLLASPAHVRAHRFIIAWALIVVIHAIVAGISALALQLMADDDIRPASEVRWESIRSWALRNPAADWPVAPPPSPANPESRSESAPADDPWHEPPAPPPDEDRVSWQAASDAAWLADSGRDSEPDGSDTDHPASDDAS